MTEPEQPEPQAGPVVKVARDLSEIEKLSVAIEAQALAKSNDRLMPGGRAMVSLAPDADLDEWAEYVAAAELRHFARCDEVSHKDCTIHGAEHVEDEDDQNAEDPLRTLLFWSDDWRTLHGYPLEGRVPTLVTEARFIRHFLDFAWSQLIEWDDFATDINRARRTLESILSAGRSVERTRVPCVNPMCPADVGKDGVKRRRLLIKVHGATEAFDMWKCTRCKTRYDKDEFARAYAKHLRSEGAQKFVPLVDAVATLKSQGRAERTIRKWLADEDEPVGTKVQGGRTFVWWPDLWTRHLLTETRKRSA